MYYNVFEKNGFMYYSYKGSNGQTILKRENFRPKVGIISDVGDYKDIFGRFLEVESFSNGYEYNKFIKSNTNLAGVIKPIYQFISHKFKEQSVISKPDVWFLDIEVYTRDKFPKPKDAMYMINACTLYSVLEDNYYTVSLKEYTPKQKNVKYVEAVNEEHLIELILRLIEDKNIQIISGWNVKYFDMYYLLTRIKNNFIDSNTIIRNWYEENTNSYNGQLETIQVLDYMDVYKLFSKKIEKYTLDFVSKHEIGEGKVPTDVPLWKLYDENFETFIDYNIKDVELLSKIDDKRKLLETVMDLSNNMKVLPTDVSGTIALWNSYLYFHLMNKKMMLPYTKIDPRSIIGGFVGDLPFGAGRYYNVVIADIESSYPHQIMQFNISPETLVEKVPEELVKIREHLGYVNLKDYYKFVKDIISCCDYTDESGIFTYKFKIMGIVENSDLTQHEKLVKLTQSLGIKNKYLDSICTALSSSEFSIILKHYIIIDNNNKISEDKKELLKEEKYESLRNMYNYTTQNILVNLLSEIKNKGKVITILTKLLKKHNLTMAGNCEFYTLEKKGMLPEVVEIMFGVRKNAKNNSESLEKILYDLEQDLKK
jgi:DNA polymerase elongation subunit (family B)